MKLNLVLNNYDVSFKSSQSLKHVIPYSFKELKHVSGVNCACCGNKLINPIDFKNAFRSITLPLKKIMESNCFPQNWKNSPLVWEFLTNLTEKYPKKSFDQIDSIDPDMYNQILGIIKKNVLIDPKGMVFRNEDHLAQHVKTLYQDLVHRSRAHLKGSKQVVKSFRKFKKNLTDEKLKSFEQLEIYSQKYPKMRLSEILAIDEIHKFHELKDFLQRAETREKSDFHFNNIEEFIKKAKPEALDEFQELKNKALELLEQEDDINARIPRMKMLYREALINNGCEKLIPKVNKELDQVPTTYITKDSFLAYANRHKMNDFQILSSIFTPYISSFEHIIPSSKGGKDSSNNGILFCRSCNLNRRALHYLDFITFHPNMPKNTEKQVKLIANKILKGELDESFIFYPPKVAETLRKYTEGLINPDISDYLEKQNLSLETEICKKKDKKEELVSEQKLLEKELSNLKLKMKELGNSIYQKNSEINDISTLITEDVYKKRGIEKYIDDKKE